MTERQPQTELDRRFSSAEATPTPWSETRRRLEEGQTYWLTTVRPDGHPHVTPLLAVWLDGAIYFCTGDGERKAKNLAQNAHCAITTGSQELAGLDVVVEGDAVKIGDEARLRQLAEMWRTKYGWDFSVRDGAFFGDGNRAPVYELKPTKVLGFGKGEPYSQTRFSF
jgi:general stress protein 26